MTVTLEVAVTTPADARAARSGGADRVELSSALELGGLTPSLAAVEAVREEGLPVEVLVRPRPGDFCYDADELRLMRRDIAAVLDAGAAGIVVGALDEAGRPAADALRRLVDAARCRRPDVAVTFHRAVDTSPDPMAVVAALADLGVDRVLTSGAAASVCDGTATLRSMVEAAGRVQVTAGGGLRPSCVAAVLDTGVAAVHLSAKREMPAAPFAVPLGSDPTSSRWVTDPAQVAAIRAELDRLSPRRGPSASSRRSGSSPTSR